MSDETKNQDQAISEPILIKKYPNRRLYNTKTSTYIVLDDIVSLIKSNTPFVIQDKKTGEDITRSILNQIIFDRETASEASHYHFSLEVQKQLIGMYDDAYSSMVPDFLKQSLSMFKSEQEKMQEKVKDVMGENSKIMMDMTQNMARYNLELFKKSMDMFTPTSSSDESPRTSPSTEGEPAENRDQELEEIQDQINALQERLKQLK